MNPMSSEADELYIAKSMHIDFSIFLYAIFSEVYTKFFKSLIMKIYFRRANES